MAAAKKTPKPGLYANIHAKQERIAHGSGETMRKPGSAGAPSDHAFEAAARKKAGKGAAKNNSEKHAPKSPRKSTAAKT
jgi:hypothetical protein